MKILVIGDVHGNIDIVNNYIERSECDFVLCAGDFGMFYRKNKSNLPKQFESSGNFYEYLEGKKKFLKPIFTVYGVHEDHSLVKRIIEKKIIIENFNIIENGKMVEYNNIKIGGIGGSFSPIAYERDKLVGSHRKHFTKSQFLELLSHKDVQIVLLHDLIGQCSKKKIKFSDEILDLMTTTGVIYCFVGKYHWWGKAPLPGKNIVILPDITKGYLVIDTDNDWRAEGIRFDFN